MTTSLETGGDSKEHRIRYERDLVDEYRCFTKRVITCKEEQDLCVRSNANEAYPKGYQDVFQVSRSTIDS